MPLTLKCASVIVKAFSKERPRAQDDAHAPLPYVDCLSFIEKMQKLIDKQPSLTEIPRAQRRAAKRALAEFAGSHERIYAIALAYLSGQHTMSAIADHFGVHYTTVSRLMKAYEVDQKA